MEKKLIGRGVLAGGLGGLLAFVFARIFAEPLIQKAIDYESNRDAAQAILDKAAGTVSAPEGPEIFSRTVQADVGIAFGLILFGAAIGAIFAVAYAVCIGRTGSIRPRPLALLLGAAGFVGFYLVPFIKYPANPPAVGHGETIRTRGALYLVMLFCSLLFLFLAVYFAQKLAARVGNTRACLIAAAGFAVAIGIVMALLPSFGHLAINVQLYGRHATETPLPLRDPDGNIVYPGFDADLLYRFRLYSIGAQLIMWTTIALLFGPYAEKLLSPPSEAAREDAPVSA